MANCFVKSKYWQSIDFRLAAELAAIKFIQPKLVITFVDNSRRFNFLSRIYLKATFIGVQNGLRGIEVADMAEYLCQTNFFCFGEETKKTIPNRRMSNREIRGLWITKGGSISGDCDYHE